MEQNMNPVPPGAGEPYTDPRHLRGEPVIPPAAEPEPERRTGFAIASLVLGIISLIGPCFCCIHFITAPLAIIFGAVSLAKRLDGKGFSVTGVTLGILSLLMTVMIILSLRPILQHFDVISADVAQLVEEQDEVFPAYEADGTLPAYLSKYLEEPYSDILREYDITIYDIMDILLPEYKNGRLKMFGTGVRTETSGTETTDEVSGTVGDTAAEPSA